MVPPMSIAILVVAAGRGERLGHSMPKAFVPLAGKPILLHTLSVLNSVPEVDALLPVIASEDLDQYRTFDEEWSGLSKLCEPVFGGEERQDSVRAGLARLADDVEIVLVHDAARPLVLAEEVSRLIAKIRTSGAAILASPVRDTVKHVAAGVIQATPERGELFAAQTPQGFRRALLEEAMQKATDEGFLGTDDAQLVERIEVERIAGGDRQRAVVLPKRKKGLAMDESRGEFVQQRQVEFSIGQIDEIDADLLAQRF